MKNQWLSSEPLIFLYTIIFTINYTVLPQLVVQKICLQESNYNATTCNDLAAISDQTQKDASQWWFFLLLGSLLPSVFTVLAWGPITDTIGRKRAMVFVPIVNATRSLIYLLNSYFMDAHVAYLLFGSFLSCFYGEFQGVVALCYAYMADVTSDNVNHRTMRMAFVEAGVFFAGIPSGLLSGYLLERIGYVSVFVLTIGINICILVYVLCCLPDATNHSAVSPVTSKTPVLSAGNTKDDSENPDTTCRELNLKPQSVSCNELFNPLVHFKQVFKVVTHYESRQVVLPLILAFGFSVCAVLGELIVQTLYLKNRPFIFSPQEIGYYSAIQAAIRGFGVILITQLSHHLFHFNDFTLIVVGLLSQILCYVLIGSSRTKLSIYLVNIAGLAVPVATTALRSLATKHVWKENYGAVLASLEAIDAISGVVTNALSLWTYNLTLEVYSGVTYFGLACFSLISLLIVSFTFCREHFVVNRIL